MTFRQFVEQGTKFSITGFGAGGRAGQDQHTPERMSGPLPRPKPDPITSSLPKPVRRPARPPKLFRKIGRL